MSVILVHPPQRQWIYLRWLAAFGNFQQQETAKKVCHFCSKIQINLKTGLYALLISKPLPKPYGDL